MAELSFDLTTEDLRRFYWSRMWQGRSRVIFGVAAIALGAVQLARGGGLLGAALTIVLFVLFYYGWMMLNWITFRRQLIEDSGLIGPRTLQVGPEGIQLSTKAGQGLMNWSAIRDIRRVAADIHVILKPRTVMVIPGHAFSGVAAKEQFLGLMIQTRIRHT